MLEAAVFEPATREWRENMKHYASGALGFDSFVLGFRRQIRESAALEWDASLRPVLLRFFHHCRQHGIPPLIVPPPESEADRAL